MRAYNKRKHPKHYTKVKYFYGGAYSVYMGDKQEFAVEGKKKIIRICQVVNILCNNCNMIPRFGKGVN